MIFRTPSLKAMMKVMEISEYILNERHPKYQLQDIQKANLMRDIFPYDEVPKITFDHKIVPIEPAKEMFITDTTFRDGQQARPPYKVEQIVTLFDMMHRLSGPNGVIRQTEFFVYSKRGKEAVEKCLAREYEFPEVTGWIRAVEDELKIVADIGLKETGILMSASDYHIFRKLKKTRKEAMEWYISVVRAAIELGIKPRCHLEDITRADFYGFVIPFVQKLMDIALDSGVQIKIRACDTMGFGITYPGASLPRSVPKLIWGLRHEGGVPSEQLEWHGHNDFHKVLTNGATAWLYGCSSVNGTLLGFGERTGNPPIEGLIIEYIGLRGGNNGINTTIITEIANYFREDIKAHIAPNYPFVGAEFNTTRAGIHADGTLKDEEIYNIFNTTLLLNRPPHVAITDKSGLAGVAQWVNKHLELTGDEMLDKRHPGIYQMHCWVNEQYKEGRITAISDEEMLQQGRKYIPEKFITQHIFNRLKQKAGEIAIRLIESVIDVPDMTSMDPKHQEPIMQKLVNEEPFIQFAYVTDLNGNQTTRHITQVYDRGKFESFDFGANFSDREWFIEPLKDGKPHVMDFYISKITDELCITVSAPIRDATERPVGVLGLDMKFEELVVLLEEDESDE